MSFGGQPTAGDFEYNGSSPNGLFAKRAHLVTPWFHRMVADLVRFNREARELLRAERRGPVAAGTGSRSGGFSHAVHRAADRAPGVGGVVGRPAPDVDVPRALPGRVLRQPRDARLRATGRSWRTVAGGSRRYVGRGRSRRWPTGCASTRRSRRSALRRPRRARRRAAASRSASTRSCWPRTPTRRCGCSTDAVRPRARDPRRDPLPAQRGGPAHRPRACCRAAGARGRAGTTTCSTRRPACRRVTYHMNRLQALQPDRELCVTLNRSAAIDPDRRSCATIPYAHPVFTAEGVAAQARHHEISGRHAARTTAAPTGAGASTRTASSARERVAAALRMPARAIYDGHDPPPPLRRARARLPPPDRAGLRRPRRRARPSPGRGRGCCASGARTTCDETAVRDARPQRTGTAPTARSGC